MTMYCTCRYGCNVETAVIGYTCVLGSEVCTLGQVCFKAFNNERLGCFNVGDCRNNTIIILYDRILLSLSLTIQLP